MGKMGASCFHTLTPDTRDIEKDAWDQERVGMVCEKADVFANWKEAILKFCRMTGQCTYEFEQAITNVVDNLQIHGLL